MSGYEFSFEITEDEAKIYDRQIRLWGLDAQKRLRAARVLVIGLGGLGSEVAKNIILAGVKSIHFMDDQKVSEKDLRSQIFIRKIDLGTNRAIASIKKARSLNPMVDVTAESSSIREKPLTFFSTYDVICANCMDWKSAESLDNHCRKEGIKLFLGGCFGLYGYMLSDLGHHEYASEVQVVSQDQSRKSLEKNVKTDNCETKIVRKVIDFPTLQDVLAFRWSNEDNAKKSKSPPTGFFFCRVVSEFMSKHERIPESESQDEDMKMLENIRAEMLRDTTLEDQHVPLTYLEECYGEINPLCTILGGVIAQDVLKAVSQKDQPHNNFFFFDGVLSCGSVEQIGHPV